MRQAKVIFEFKKETCRTTKSILFIKSKFCMLCGDNTSADWEVAKLWACKVMQHEDNLKFAKAESDLIKLFEKKPAPKSSYVK